MTCEVVNLPDGTRAIVCSTRSRARCCKCGRRSHYQCDWKVPTRKSGTCDKHLCANCTTSPAPDKDLCPDHAAEWANRQAQRHP